MQYVALLLFISTLSLSQPVFAQTWSDPIGTPPSDNASTPVNISATSQVKSGGFGAASLSAVSSAIIGGNLMVGAGVVPTDPVGIRSSGTYGDAYSKWSSIGRAFSAFPLSLPATDYGLGTVWDGSGAFFGLTNSGTNKKDTVIGWGSSIPNPTDLVYKYNGTEVARMTSAGRLGIGITNPSGKLQINNTGFIPASNTASALKLSGTYGGGLVFEDTAYSGIWSVDGGQTMAFGSNGTTSGFGSAYGQMVLKNGNLGIGTSTPTQKLSVVGNITGTQLCIGTDCRSSWPSVGGSGTVTSIIAGTGLTGGTITASGTIAADTAYLQRRVSGTCAAGNAIQTIAADGTVTCQSTASAAEADTLATVTTRGNTTTNGISVGSFINNGGSYFAGNVGVGTATPGGKLEVVGTTRLTQLGGSFDFRPVSSSQFAITPSSDVAHSVNLLAGWNATRANDATLNVYGKGTSAWNYLSLTHDGTVGHVKTMGSAGAIALSPLGSERMRITADGNVGIGTTTPDVRFDVGAGEVKVARSGLLTQSGSMRMNLGQLTLGRSSVSSNAVDVGFVTSSTTAPQLFLSGVTGNSYFTGNLGIGTTAPGQKLTVAGTIESTSGGVKFPDGTTQTTAAGASNLHAVTTAGNTTTNGISVGSFINNGGSYFVGNVGVGTATPGAKLEVYAPNTDGIRVRGDNAYTSYYNTAGARQGYLQGAGGNMVLASDSGVVAINTSSAERIRVAANGNVGIGTATPGAKLDVAGTINATTLALAGAPAYVNEGYGWRYHGDSQHPLQVLDGAPVAIGYTATGGTYPSSGLVVSGNAGIGTASPTQKLEVAGDTLSNNNRIAAGNGNGICFWNDCNNYKITMGSGADYQYGSVTDYSIKSTMNNGASNRGWTWGYAGVAPVASISGGGNLNVAGVGQFSGNTQIGSVSQGFYGDGGNLALRTYNSGSSGIYFQTYNGATTNMYLSNGGSLGIGNAAPSEKLDVSGGMRMGSGNFTQNVAHGNYHVVQLPAAANGGGTGDAGLYTWVSEPAATWTGVGIARNMRNSSGAFPRVNTALSGQMIRFDEGTGISFTVENAAGTRTNPMWMNASMVTIPNLTSTLATFNTVNANSFVYSSDRKLKKNIEPIENALDKITSLNGVTFNWKTDKDGAEKKIGLIAQDVEKVFPEAVAGTTTKGVEYANLVAPLVEAVKEQQKTIESQEARIKALEERLNKLVK